MHYRRELQITLLLVLLLIGFRAGSAQDAASVLQHNIEYRALKSGLKLAPELARELGELERRAREATNDGRYGEAHRFIARAMTRATGRAWTARRELAAALRLESERVILEPGQAVTLRLSLLFIPEQTVTERLQGMVAIGETREGRYQTLNDLAPLDDDPSSLTKGRRITITVPSSPPLPDGEYQLALSYFAGRADEDSIFRTVQVEVAQGIGQRLEELGRQLAAFDGRRQPELTASLAKIEYTIGMARRLDAGEIQPAGNSLRRAVSEAAGLLAEMVAGRNPLSTRRGDIHLAYRSAVDQSLQPYRLYVPAGYRSDRKWPLAVALHGWGGDENTLFEGRRNGEIKRVAEAHGYLVVCPKGRGPTSFYLGAAEQDVLEVIASVRRDYAIDDERIFLLGHSMGGHGAWAIAASHPEMFAAIAPIAGIGSPLVTGRLKRLAGIPWLVTHGTADQVVPIEESRRMVAAGRRLGIEIRFDEVEGGDHFNVFAPALKGIFEWFDAHPRLKPASRIPRQR